MRDVAVGTGTDIQHEVSVEADIVDQGMQQGGSGFPLVLQRMEAPGMGYRGGGLPREFFLPAAQPVVTKGFEIILEDKKVRAILINIFGGILRCDVQARGVLAAAQKTDIRVPLIVRLEGTNVKEGRRILEDSGLKFLVAKDMAEAAELVTKQVSGSA